MHEVVECYDTDAYSSGTALTTKDTNIQAWQPLLSAHASACYWRCAVIVLWQYASWALCLLEATDSLLLAWPQVTAPMAPHWGDLRARYVEPLLRGLERMAVDPAGPAAELALVCFGAATPFSACPLDRAGWTSEVPLFRRWLDAVVPAGGGRQQTVLTGAPC